MLTLLLILILVPIIAGWLLRLWLKWRAHKLERETEQNEQQAADRERIERMKREFKRSGEDTPFEEM